MTEQPTCGWNPATASTECDWDRTCPVHGTGQQERLSVDTITPDALTQLYVRLEAAEADAGLLRHRATRLRDRAERLCGERDRLLAVHPDEREGDHPAEQSWQVELHDGAGWMPVGLPYKTPEAARAAKASRAQQLTTWAADGSPVRLRITRQTTTWTVEEEEAQS